MVVAKEMQMTRLRLALLFLFLSLSMVSQAQTKYTVSAIQVNPLITRDTADNYIYINDSVASLHKLFVFFPGSGAVPKNYQYILKTAANLGYHAIGLTYVNDTTVGSLCAGQDPTCQGLARKEIFTGQDYSSVVEVDSVDGIHARLTDLLNYLDATYPNDNWGQFFAQPDSIDWTKVCVSGHSQGAGMASIIAYWFLVDRGAFFAVGGDWSTSDFNVAAWMDSTSATPPARKYSFDHRQDELFWGVLNETPVIFDTLGLYAYGTYISVDTITNNFYGRHAFTSNDTIGGISLTKYHGCVVADYYTPLNAGVPVYQPVWQYMLTDTIADTSIFTTITETDNNVTISAFPNPTNGILQIKLNVPTPGYIISVSDIAGQVLRRIETENTLVNIDLSPYARGVYFIRVSSVMSSRLLKIVKD